MGSYERRGRDAHTGTYRHASFRRCDDWRRNQSRPGRCRNSAHATAPDAARDSGATDAAPAREDGGTSPTRDAAMPVSEAGALPDAGAPGSCSEDPLQVLRRFAPKDKDLAADYDDYLLGELGQLDCQTGGRSGARVITRTIFVPPNAVYDGQGERLTADVVAMRCDTTLGEQAESQRPFFLLAPGAQLKNVSFTYPGCEGCT